jgi:hypothetical protein
LRQQYCRISDIPSDDNSTIVYFYICTQNAWKKLDLAKLEESELILKVSDTVSKLPPSMFYSRQLRGTLERAMF